MKNAVQRWALSSVAAAALAPVMAPAASAQENPFARDRYQAVTDRPQPAFDPLPLRVGPWFVQPSLGVGALYNDNVFSESTNAVEDVIYTVTPAVEARTNWSRHEAVIGLNGSVNASRQNEPRYNPAAVSNAAELVPFTVYGGAVSGTFQASRTQLEIETGATDFNFEDVRAVEDNNPATPPTVDQDFRDNMESWVRVRASYAVSPDVAFYVEPRLTYINFANPADFSNPANPQFDRDATRIGALLGASFEFQAPFGATCWRSARRATSAPSSRTSGATTTR